MRSRAFCCAWVAGPQPDRMMDPLRKYRKKRRPKGTLSLPRDMGSELAASRVHEASGEMSMLWVILGLVDEAR
jgi:hypothetical protein